jgi:uncharacterized protein (TIGR03437 family)
MQLPSANSAVSYEEVSRMTQRVVPFGPAPFLCLVSSKFPRRVLKGWPFLLLCWFALALPVAAQVSVSGWTPPARSGQSASERERLSLAEKIGRGQAPLSRKYPNLKLENVRVVRLETLPAEALRQKTPRRKMRIGVTRPITVALAAQADSTIFETPEGRLGMLRVISPGALLLRLHLTQVALPAGARLFVYSAKNPDEFYGPYLKPDGGEFWTPPLTGDEVVVEYLLPNVGQSQMEKEVFHLSEVSHIFANPREQLSQITAQNCQREVPAEWREAAKSTALVEFVQPDGEYLCSGTLLNDTSDSGTPYLLTANHCFNNQRGAESLTVYWLYDTQVTHPDTLPRNFGAKLLATGAAADFTLVQLRSAPPPGVRYAGWTTEGPAPARAMTGIHHPEGEYKRIAFGNLLTPGCDTSVQGDECRNTLPVQWTAGVTAAGSSGSGLYVGTAADPKLVGSLIGGDSSCINPRGVDYYGRFDLVWQAAAWFLTGRGCAFYVSLEEQLAPAAGTSGVVQVTAREGTDCSWTATSDAAWVTITTGSSGNGDGEVRYSIEPNRTNSPRVTQLTIAGNLVTITQQAATYNCTPAQLQLGQTVNGELNANNCRSVVNPAAKAQRYTFQASAGQVTTIRLTSQAFDGYLLLLGPNGEVLGQDDDGGGALNARIPSGDYYLNKLILPATGTYTLEVTSLDERAAGAYSLQVEKDCVFLLKRTTQQVSASGRDFLNGRYFNGAIDLEVSADRPGACGIAVSDDETWVGSSNYAIVDPGKTQTTFSVTNNGSNQQRSATMLVGNVPIVIRQYPYCGETTRPTISPAARSFDGRGGTGTVDVAMVPGAFCTWDFKRPEDIAGGNSIGIISPAYFMLEGTGPQQFTYGVSIYAGVKPISRIITIAGQPHTVTQTPAGAQCPTSPLPTEQKINGTLANTDCQWLPEPNSFADYYSFSGAAGHQVAFNFGSPDQAVQFRLFDPAGRIVAESAGQKEYRYPESDFVDLPSEGTYTLAIYGAPGRYSVELLRFGAPHCAYRLPDYPDERAEFGAEGGTKEALLTATASCPWTITGNPGWISFPEGSTGTGSQAIKLIVPPNPGAFRNATLKIAGRTYYVLQNAACSYVRVRPDYANSEWGLKLYVRPTAETLVFRIDTGRGCPPLQINSLSDWLTEPRIFGNQGFVKYQTNPTGAVRVGKLEIGGQQIEIIQGAETLATVSAASFAPEVAPQSIVSVFGEGLATQTASATTYPLPSQLGGTSILVKVKTQSGEFEELAPLFFVSSKQINFELPASISPDNPIITVYPLNGLISSGRLKIARVAPALFSMEATGQGLAAAVALRIKADGTQNYEPIARFDPAQNRFVAVPLELGAPSDQVFLLLFGTGIRGLGALTSASVKIGGLAAEVSYAGPQGTLVGLDQVNARLPRSLSGRGEVEVALTVEGKPANIVKIAIK